MPVKKRGKKWAIGGGRGRFKTRAAAERALKGYYKWLKKNGKSDKVEEEELPLFEEFVNSLQE